ncbi:hypothetical protein AVEN_179955-1, partial [Araneus ventricosus]
DGCGRTGTYLCIEANLELAGEDFCYDVFGYAKKLRASRRGMIETLEHYKFIYDALEEANICGSTWFPVNALSQQLKYKSMKNPVTRMNEYQREYQLNDMFPLAKLPPTTVSGTLRAISLAEGPR